MTIPAGTPPAQVPPAAGDASTTNAPASGTQATTTTETAAPKAPATPAELVLNLPKDAKVDEKVLGAFKALMSDEKLTPQERAQKLIDLQFQQVGAQKAADEAAIKKLNTDRVEALKKQHGGEYDKVVAKVQGFLKQHGGEEVSKELAAHSAENSPVLVNFFHKLAGLISEDSIGKTTANKGNAVETEEARLRRMLPTSYDQIQKGRNTA